MLIVGLTGGIGSGKTTVTDIFKDLGIDIVDADVIARDVTRNNTQVKEAIFDAFGEHLRTADNHIDRPQLRDIIFNDPNKKAQLEAITHPVIRSQIQNALSAPTQANYKIYSSPLLFEKQQQKLTNKVIVVDVPVSTQIKRTTQRDKQTAEQVQRIIHAQCSREERLKQADFVINNNQTHKHTHKQVELLHQQLQLIAEQE